MKRMIAAMLIALPLPALAEECGRWSASMQEDEGGPVMTAEICAPAGKEKNYLYVLCSEPGKLWMRYLTSNPSSFNPSDGNFQTDLEFTFDTDKFTHTAQYEGMDGAMTFQVEIASPFVQGLKSSKQVELKDTAGKVPGTTFALAGSSAALAKLTKTCGK